MIKNAFIYRTLAPFHAVDIGKLAEVAEYCKHDVAITRDVFRRMTFQTVEVANTEDLLF